jgi:hypothetical protein
MLIFDQIKHLFSKKLHTQIFKAKNFLFLKVVQKLFFFYFLKDKHFFLSFKLSANIVRIDGEPLRTAI